MYTLLVLEDDAELNQTISNALRNEGYRVLTAFSCQEAKSLVMNQTFDLAVLDVSLPDGDGFRFCKWMKARCNVSVLFLSARDLEDDVLNGYESGADDYVTKPFSMKILLKKISVILSREPKNPHIYDDGFLKIDFELGIVHTGEQDCPVTPTEYKILKYFLENKNQVLTQNQILEAVWDREGKFVNPNTLQVNIGRLRKKIGEDPSRPGYIKTVHGIGYIWEE